MFIAVRFLLGLSGGLLIVIGGAILLSPEEMFAMNGITLQNNPSLLSEIRAPAGLLFASGSFVLISAFVRSWAQPALLLSSLVYSSYGLVRLLSMALDGPPSHSLVQATIIELVIGAACLLAAKTAVAKRRA